jgi:sugar transferase (PEP-CTERM/EpsH1 system associated)
MRDLLFLSHRVPYPPDKGEKIRAWHMFRRLAGAFRIHLGCFVDDMADWPHVEVLRQHCAELACFPLSGRQQRAKALLRLRPGQPLSLGYFHDARLASWVRDKLAEGAISDAFVFSSAMAPYLMDTVHVRRVLDMVDIDSEKWRTYAAKARWPARTIWAREARTLLAFERLAAQHFDHSLFVSRHEWQHFIELAPEAASRTGWVDNGVDTEHFSPHLGFAAPFAGEDAELVFTARMDYRPNIDAATWFAGEVLPLVRTCFPGARFWIVGASPTREVLDLAQLPGVQVTGRVADTRPYLAAADIAVAPLRIARGIQNKVLEAMAMAKPVVATPEAFEGVHAEPGRDILLASGSEDTAQRIADVLQGLHPNLGPAARRAMQTNHQWSVTLAPLNRLFDIAGQDGSHPSHAEIIA